MAKAGTADPSATACAKISVPRASTSNAPQRFHDGGQGLVVTDVPGEHDVGMPWAGPDTGSHIETMPGSIVPRHQARRMPRPSVAVSEEVMPPLARTNAGRTWATISRTVPTSEALTVRAMCRLSAASVPLTRVRLVRITMSLSDSLSRRTFAASAATPLTWSSRALSSSRVGTSSSSSMILPLARSWSSWRVVSPTWEPTTISPCSVSGRVSPSSCGAAARISVSRPASIAGVNCWPLRERTNDGPVR